MASTRTSAASTGAPAPFTTLPVRRSSGWAAIVAAAATATQASHRLVRTCMGPPLSGRRHPASVNHNAGTFSRVAPLVQDHASVDDHRGDADWVLERIRERGAIGDR